MATCANCTNDAFFAYLITSEFKVPYCAKHLPKFLSKTPGSSRLVRIEPVEVSPEPPLTKLSKKKSVAEEPVVEEPTSDDLPEEEPVIDEGELEVEEGI